MAEKRTDTELLEAVVTKGLRPQRWGRGPWFVATQDRIVTDPATDEIIEDADWRVALGRALDAEATRTEGRADA